MDEPCAIRCGPTGGNRVRACAAPFSAEKLSEGVHVVKIELV